MVAGGPRLHTPPPAGSGSTGPGLQSTGLGAQSGPRRLGFIVNPLAGIGGRVGLKGSDGAEIVRRARELGAQLLAPGRAGEALTALLGRARDVVVVTAAGQMGEDEARALGVEPVVVGSAPATGTTSADTREAARAMRALGVDLLLFAGGDGTARDICDAVGDGVVALGIPSGCKMHSAVYAATPSAAGELAAAYLLGRVRRVVELEVMDIDEEAFRHDIVAARLYGYLRVPDERRLTQGAKIGGGTSDELNTRLIAQRVVAEMRPGGLYFIGPGTTTRAVMDELGLPDTLLGVDAVTLDAAGTPRLLAADAPESRLLELLDDAAEPAPQPDTARGGSSRSFPVPPPTIIVTVIGGQGYIFGRGNQQLSPDVIRRVGREHIRVIATRNKINALPLHQLRVDTGDPEVDALLRGYVRVVVSGGEEAVLRVV